MEDTDRLGRTAYIRYRGCVRGDRPCDDRSDGEPLAVRIGGHRVPKGVERALLMLEVGESCTLVIPPEEGYGAADPKLVQWYPRSVLDHVEQYDAAVFEELFIVASVSFVEGEELSAEVRKTTAEKCPRCWNYRELGGNPNHPSVCERCGDVLDAIGYEEAGSDA